MAESKLDMSVKNMNNFIKDDHGETLVEVLVAFIVLMIVIAMFTGSTRFAGASVTNSIDIRRTYDSEYESYRSEISYEEKNGSPRTPSMRTSEPPVTISITGTDGNHDLTAYQYESGDSIYWVFR